MALELFGALTQVIDPAFIILSLLFGYLVFFLYFYGSQHWNQLQWGDRTLLGWLLGVMLLISTSFTYVLLDSWFQLTSGSTMNHSGVVLLWFLNGLTLVLLLFVVRGKGPPLHSDLGKKRFDYFLNTRCFLVIHFIVFFSIFMPNLISSQYSYLMTPYLQEIWRKFLATAIYSLVFSYCLTLFLLYALTSLPALSYDTFLHHLFPFRQDRNWNSRTIGHYVIGILLMLSLAFAFTSFDAAYSLITPKIVLTESRVVVDGRMHLTRDNSMEFLVLVMNQKVFHIQAPSSDISISTFQITYPSNFSSSLGPYQGEITTTSGLECEYLSGSTGSRENIRFTIKSPRLGVMRAEMSYYDRLKNVGDYVAINENRQWGLQTFPNGSISGKYALEMTNIGAYSISIDQVVLFYMPGSNTTYFNLRTETNPAGSHAWVITSTSGRQLRLHGQIGPGASILVSIYMLYRE